MSRPGDYDTVRKDIIKLLDQPEYDDGSAGPVLVRLAWHASGTYSRHTSTGGSNGAGMRWEAEGGDPANAGLQHARAFLEPLKTLHPWITYSDLWTLAGVVAIAAMGGPTVPWHSGRTDFLSETDVRVPPRGRLPDAAQGADHVRAVFKERMGFSDQEIVALCGAHNLGRCHSDRSGYEGAWVNNPVRFANTYFKLLSDPEIQWKPKTLPNGLMQFVYFDEDSGEELMMLPSDMALLQDEVFAKWVRIYAKDKERFFADFAKAFAKLLELGIRRDAEGRVVDEQGETQSYVSAPKKPDQPQAPERSSDDRHAGGVSEAEGLRRQNERFRERVGGGVGGAVAAVRSKL